MLSIVYWILYIFNFARKITTNFWNVQIFSQKYAKKDRFYLSMQAVASSVGSSLI